MKLLNHSKADKPDAILLIRELNQKEKDIQLNYTKLSPAINMFSIGLAYNDQGKCPVSVMKPHCEDLLKTVKFLGCKVLLVADASYFKYLTKVKKVAPHHGYILNCKLKGYEDIKVILSITYTALFHNPGLQLELDLSLATLSSCLAGTHVNIGTNILRNVHYPVHPNTIAEALDKLHEHPTLTCDIETLSLIHISEPTRPY